MREKIIRVVLADENNLLLKGITIFFETDPLIEIYGIANDGLRLEELIKKQHPDIVISNPFLPGKDGIVVVREKLRKKNKLKWIALDMEVDFTHYMECVDTGAKGYITYNSGYSEIAHAIKEVEKGEDYICKQAFPIVTKQFVSSYLSAYITTNSTLFTEKQRKIIHLTCLGYTSTQQGIELGLNGRTIEDHKQAIYRKAKVNNAVSLVVYALKTRIESLATLSTTFILFALDEESVTYTIPDFLSSFSFV
jgi:DNA-binding NarL/FixJ family response regulator